ncbi:MAG: hypothetical protein AAF696_03230 [Bacteroidota bacterium]
MKRFTFLFLLLISFLPGFSQLAIGGGASHLIPMNRNSEFYGANQGFKLFFTPDVSDDDISWNFGFGWSKFEPRREIFNTETPNGVKGDVSYTNYTTVPVFAGLDFKINARPISFFVGAYVGGNFISYEVSSRDVWGRRTLDYSGLNAFFSPRVGANLIDTDRFSLQLDAQYYATLNKKAGWIEDYVAFSLIFMYKTSVYM